MRIDHLPLITEPDPTDIQRLGMNTITTSDVRGSKMTKLKMTSALFSLAMMASPALAQDFVDAKIQELFAQGYTHFEVSRGFLRTEIEAYGPNFTKLEIRLSNADGSVVSERTQIESPAEYSENVREISQTNSNIREELDDNDGPEAHSESVSDDLYDGANDDRYEGVNDDRYDGVDDDRYENEANDREDDHGFGGYESRDDGRDDDHDDDRNGDHDDDGHDSDGHDGDDD